MSSLSLIIIIIISSSSEFIVHLLQVEHRCVARVSEIKITFVIDDVPDQ